MCSRRTTALVALALPLAAFGANKDVAALQSDVKLLQQDVGVLQQSVEENAGAIKALAQQILNGVSAVNSGMAVSENRLSDRLDARAGRITFRLQSIRESMAALNNRLDRLEQQLNELDKAVKPNLQESRVN